MEDYEFVFENGQVKMRFNGVNHAIGKAFTKGKNILYIHPSREEIAQGIEAISHELTEEDILNIQDLLDQS